MPEDTQECTKGSVMDLDFGSKGRYGSRSKSNVLSLSSKADQENNNNKKKREEISALHANGNRRVHPQWHVLCVGRGLAGSGQRLRVPTAISSLKNVMQVSCGSQHIGFVTETGRRTRRIT